MRVLLAGLLFLDGLGTALHIAALLPALGVFDTTTLALIGIRAIVGALALTGGWWLLSRRPTAAAMAGSALLLSATLTTLEAGARLAPSGVTAEAWRWPYVVISWIYAIAWVWWLKRRS